MLAKKRSTKDCGWNQVGCSNHLEIDLIDGVYDDAQDRSIGNKVVMFLRKFTRKYRRPKYLVKPKRDY